MREADRRLASRAPPQRAAAGGVAWSRELGDWRLLLVGKRSDPPPLGAEAGSAVPPALPLAWLRQIHSARVVAARAGDCGEGDALILAGEALVARIASADCLPIVVAGERSAVAIHAGWRGLVTGIVGAAVDRLRGDGERALRAWIGPAIGPCCYEVGEAVAAAVAAASGGRAVERGRGPRPHLDLRTAARAQLEAAGVADSELLEHCTSCRPEWLWSYRRDGAGAGRNLLLLWREGSPGR